jgi:hypothetical protein
MDSQDVILWGRSQPDKFNSERERIDALCDWGRPFGLDGFVRMEFHLCVHAISRFPLAPPVLTDDSEVLLCDFSDVMEVVTFLNVLPKDQSTMPRRFPGVPVPMPPPSPSKPRQAGVACSRMDTALFPRPILQEAGTTVRQGKHACTSTTQGSSPFTTLP